MRYKLLGRTGLRVSELALRRVRQGSARMTPIVGSRQVGRLRDNLGCVEVVLSAGQQERLDTASAIELGFPYDFIRRGRSAFMGEVADRVDDHRGTVV